MCQTDVVIRRLDEGDIELVEPLWNALREHHASVAPELGPPRPRGESWLRRRAEYEGWLRTAGFMLVAECSDELVGYAMVHLRDGSATWPLSEHAGELETLSVLPEHRGKGVGSLLLDAVRSQLNALGATELSLHVVASSDDARRFYERHGFTTVTLWLSGPV